MPRVWCNSNLNYATKPWKRWSGYHQRNLIETAMHRFKRLGERLYARKPAQQAAEVYVRCAILNRWGIQLGLPVTVPRS